MEVSVARARLGVYCIHLKAAFHPVLARTLTVAYVDHQVHPLGVRLVVMHYYRRYSISKK